MKPSLVLLSNRCCWHRSVLKRSHQVLATAAMMAACSFTTNLLLAQTPAVTATPAASAAVSTTKDDLLATIKAAGNFKTFLKAAEAAGLLNTLQKPGPYTVFVPTDAAFAKMPAGALDDLLKPENKVKLVALLSYHIASGKFAAADLAKMDEVKTLEGTEIDVDTSGDGKTIELDEAKVLGNDLEATNGIVHAIDTVLKPGVG